MKSASANADLWGRRISPRAEDARRLLMVIDPGAVLTFRRPARLEPPAMIVVTTENLPGHPGRDVKGQRFGVAVRS